MKTTRKTTIAKIAAILTALPLVVWAFSSGPPPGKTGAPGDGLCTECHVGTASPGGVEVQFPSGLTYTPGVRQTWTVRLTQPGNRNGFQLTVRPASDERGGQAGDLAASDGNTQVVRNGAAQQFIEHTLAGHAAGATFTINWTPPSTDVGPVRVFVAGNAANGNGQPTGDRIFTADYTLTPAAAGGGGGGGGGNAPTISAQNGVVQGASFQPAIAPGGWITIFGTNLAPGTRTWRTDEIVGGKLPTQLDGVSVTVDNKPAAVYFISPGQINALAPADIRTGTVEVKVTTPQGASSAAQATVQAAAPGFFMFDPQNRKYVAAVHADGTFLGPANLFEGATTRPAKPGDRILLFGTGFGATDPAVTADQVVTGAPRLVEAVRILIGGAPATVEFAGLAPGQAGLYQFNVVVPEAANLDQEIVAEIGSVRTQGGAFVNIQR